MNHQSVDAQRIARGGIGELAQTASRQSRGTSNSMVVPRVSETVAPELSTTQTVSDVLINGLVSLGAKTVFGLFGGGIAPFYKALSSSALEMIICRSESGAAFAAIESSLATGRLVVVATTTGPGLTNLFTGMVAARWEGARVVFVSGCSRPPQRGRWAFQETGGGGNPLQSLYSSGTLFHYAAMIEDPSEIETALTRVATGLQQPNGFVAHIGLPINIQNTPVARSYVPSVFTAHSGCGNDGALAEIVSLIAEEQLVIWAGFGARDAGGCIREFIELTQTPIMCSPRAKGVFPEDHPLYMGVTGLGGSKQLDEHFAQVRPERVLVLGSRLGEMTSFWSESLIPPNGIVHIDVDPSVFGAAYPRAHTVGIVGDVGACLRQFITGWPKSRPHRKELSFLKERSSHMRPHRGRMCVRPSYLMQVLQSIVVENSNAIVLTEAGNSFALGNHYLHFPEANRYRVSTGFGSMGHAAAGVLGASMGSGRKAVALVGDGSLLMLNEISTAVTYHIDAVWIVLNDSRYGMIAQGMESLGWAPFGTDFPEVDFVAIAKAVGATGIRVDSESELATAIATAMATRGPFVVDVVIDRKEQAPSGRRNQSLLQQTSTVRASQ